MEVDEALVQKLATLSRLDLDPEEVREMGGHLQRILGFLEVLGELDLGDAAPTRHGSGETSPLREDVPRPSLSRDEALENAPEPFAGHFRVPRVL